MKTRLHIQNKTQMVEWPDNLPGLLQAKAFRKFHNEFKYCRIRSVVQVFPLQVECGTIYSLS